MTCLVACKYVLPPLVEAAGSRIEEPFCLAAPNASTHSAAAAAPASRCKLWLSSCCTAVAELKQLPHQPNRQLN